MLDKHYDLTMVGKNYLSILYSMEFSDWGKSVLVIDDKRLEYGHIYSGILSEMDVTFLETWGEDKGISPLAGIRSYLSKRSVTFSIDKQRVRLGGSPYQNYMELLRKFPQLFGMEKIDWETISDEDEFNELYFSFCRRMSQNCFRFRTLQNLNLQSFITLCPKVIIDCFEHFKENLDQNRKLELIPLHQKTFFYLSRGFIQKKLSMRGNEIELFHLLMSLLSPCYELNEQNLSSHLENVFKSRGGVCKTTTVREWLFDQSKPWSLELSSFEGIIHPKRIALMGGRPESMPIAVQSKSKIFRSLDVTIPSSEELNSFFGDDYFAFTDSKRIGGRYPFWAIRKDKTHYKITLFTLMNKGMKIDFSKNQVIEILNHDFSHILGKDVDLKPESLEFGREICVEDNKNVERLQSMLKKIAIFDNSKPGSDEKLKNVHYFGPLKMGSLGLFSTLMEIKEGIRVV